MFRVARVALLELGIAALALAQVNVLNVNYDSQQTGANLQETTLAPGIDWNSFGKLGTLPVDGAVYAQPLYVTGVAIGGVKYNVLYVVTMGDSVYAFNADKPQSTTPLWRVNLGAPVPSGLFNPVPGGLSNYTDILPEIGILGTPAIDPTAQVIYVVTDTLPAGAPSAPLFQLHALSLVDGHEMLGGPVQIAASVSGKGLDSNNGTIPFYAIEELQRPGLMLANGTIYIAFGSHGDTGPYHGWMLGYSASTLQQTSVFNTTPNGRQSAIWQTGRAPAADANGNIYAVSANGDWDGVANFGQSVLRLSGADLSLLDWYTPSDWESLDGMDADIGTTGAILIPNTNYLVSGSKAGVLFLIQDDAMGHLGAATTQGVQVNTYGLFDIALWGNLPNAPTSSVAKAHAAAAAAPSSTLYEFQPAGPLKAFQIVNNQINSTILSEFTPPFLSEYAGLSISANGAADGIVWLTLANYGAAGLPGTLFALDATNLASELWSSDMNGTRDHLGAFAKFVPPTVADGRVYVATFSRAVVVYGPLSGATPPGNPTITSVVNGASYLADGVSPGELVTIFGANLGPPLAAQGSLIGNEVADSIDSTQVLFGGVASPMLFASPTQINAVVPFGVTGPTTQVQITYQGQPTVSTTVPVQPASPALFSLQSNGGGSGAILNQDGSINSRSNPAARGSVVVLYGTGGGLTTPASVDGLLTSPIYPLPNLPVSVFIDTQPAKVLYAGAAPGIVAGALQINVVVPSNASVAPFDLIKVTIGGYQSPTTVSVAVK